MAGSGSTGPGNLATATVSMQRITRFAFMLEFSDMRAADEFGEAEDWGAWTLEKTPGWKIGQPLHGKAVGVMTAARKLKEDSEVGTTLGQTIA